MSKIVENYLASIKKIIPEKNLGSSVGIDISEGNCKVVEIAKQGESYELVNWAIEHMKGTDPKPAVNSILENIKTPAKTFFTAVHGKGTLIRYIEMPKMSNDELKKSLAMEADKYFPFTKEQIYTDCHILNPKGKGNKMFVLVAAAKRELIDQRVKLLNDLDLPADFIGVNPIALANAFNVLGQKGKGKKEDSDEDEKDSAVAMIDMGEAVSSLLISVDDSPRFTRDIHIGGKELTQRIGNALGVSKEEAEKIKRDPKDRSEEVLNATESVLLNLINEMRLSFDYFTTEYNCHISRLTLTGGASLMQGCVEFLSQHLDIPVEKWEVMEAIKLGPNVSAEEFSKNANKLGVALGLALYQYS